MGRNVKQLNNYTTEQIEALFESDENNRIGIKLYAIIQLTRGYSSRKLAEFYRTSFKQICNWADRFDEEGVKGLYIKPGRGRHSRLSAEQKNQLEQDLLKNPEILGYDAVNWSCLLLQEHIKKKYHVDYKPAAVYNLTRKLGFSFQRVKTCHSNGETAISNMKTVDRCTCNLDTIVYSKTS